MYDQGMRLETLRLLTRLAVAVMAADGRITREEIDAVVALERLGLGPADVIRDEIERATRHPIDLEQTCRGLDLAAPQSGAAVLAALVDR